MALIAAAPVAHAAEAERLNVCFSSIAATSITTWVPYEAGIYKKYGLDVRIVYVAGAQAITTLISGDTHIVQGSGAAAALSRLSGSDLTVIGTTIAPESRVDAGVTRVWPLPAASTTMIPAAVSSEMVACS